LQEEKDFRWNDTIFMKAIKSIVQNGDIDLCANIQAELSPTYKRKRADSLSQRMLLTLEGAADNFGSNSTLPPCPILPNPSLQNAHDAQSAFGVGVAVVDPSSVSSLTLHQQERRRSSLKEAPKRTPEHDKWKITAKRVYVNAAYVCVWMSVG
jgi:hypothetical protein